MRINEWVIEWVAGSLSRSRLCGVGYQYWLEYKSKCLWLLGRTPIKTDHLPCDEAWNSPEFMIINARTVGFHSNSRNGQIFIPLDYVPIRIFSLRHSHRDCHKSRKFFSLQRNSFMIHKKLYCYPRSITFERWKNLILSCVLLFFFISFNDKRAMKLWSP